MDVQDCLAVTDNVEVGVRVTGREEDDSREASREAELDAFTACRFQKGFASEGMLCHEPPIPLRVLDFLETRDILNLSMVCKSAHQASHRLLEREVCNGSMANCHVGVPLCNCHNISWLCPMANSTLKVDCALRT